MAQPQGNPGRSVQAPRGTRDFYPQDMRRRRWIEDTWRQVSVRHAFEEVDGPRFEHLELYTVKSGEGIVSELFSFTRAGGETALALRPEFTPTAARMVAAKASALPKPIKWFSVGPYFRAERPQRGRLREFLQWNVDIFGDDSARADVECVLCCIAALQEIGLTSNDVRIVLNHRGVVADILRSSGVFEFKIPEALQLLDARDRLATEEFERRAKEIPMNLELYDEICSTLKDRVYSMKLVSRGRSGFGSTTKGYAYSWAIMSEIAHALRGLGVEEWCDFDVSIVRGLAYYTGMVFEVHEAGGKERAIAGGGRYDNLIELFGGPPTPAVGFAMGDVVLSLVLEDKGLMPSDSALRERTGQRVDVFVISTEATDDLLAPTVASLRRAGLHARHTHKTTRNIGKLLKEASSLGARCAAIIESPEPSPQQVTLKDLAGGGQHGVSLDALADEVIRRTRAADIPSADA